MSELIPYLKLLSTRGPSVAVRELGSRIFREDPVEACRRVMDVCERRGGSFTFFLVGLCAQDNPGFVEEVLGRGHEIACHGHAHHRFGLMSPDEARRDLETALEFYETRFGYRLKGFRAPYLEMPDYLYGLLRELGFTYSSSIAGNGAPEKRDGVIEYPISVDDWSILIRDNLGMQGLANAMRHELRDGACFLLHPWRVGQRRYIGSVEAVLDASPPSPFVAMSKMVEDGVGIALTGDVGELAWAEIIRRSILGR